MIGSGLKKICFIFFAGGILLSHLSAEILREVEVLGVGKTKVSTVEKIIGYHVGDVILPGSEDEIRQKLLKSGLFVNDTIDVSLASDGNDAVVRIYMHDRVTLLPFPVLSYSDGDLSGGSFVMDRNFIGFGHQLFAGGIYSRDSRFFMLGYSDPSSAGSLSPGGSISGFDRAVSISSIDGEDVLYEYDSRIFRSTLNLFWDKDPFRFGFKAGAALVSLSYAEDDSWSFLPELEIRYDSLFYNTYFTEGLKSEVSCEVKTYSGSLELTQNGEFRFSRQFLFHERLQWQLNGDAGISRGDSFQGLSLLRGYCGSILPDEVMADYYFQGNCKLQFALLDFSWGYLAVPVVYQVGFLDGVSGKDVFFHGPAGGLALYLKKVAIPALSLQYARNMETGTGVFKFSLGMGM